MSEHGGVLEIPVCLCGLNMYPIYQADLYACKNCDVVNENKTYNDTVFIARTREQYKKWYPDQGNKR